MSDEPRGVRLRKVLKSLVVGAGATIVDTIVLEVLTRGFHFDPTLAKFFSLICGVSTQFVGSRYFAFQAQRGLLSRQLKWFVLCEVLAFGLTMLVFHGLQYAVRRYIGGVVSVEAAQFASGSIVYFGFSYPIWNRVFKLTPEEHARGVAEQTDSKKATETAAPAG